MGEMADDLIERMWDEYDPFDHDDSPWCGNGGGYLNGGEWRNGRSGKPAPVFRSQCDRCKAAIKLKGRGPGEYHAYNVSDGQPHTCQTVASADEFPEFT